MPPVTTLPADTSGPDPGLFTFDPEHFWMACASFVLAAFLGWGVAFVYKSSRRSVDVISSFPPTLILLCF